MSETELIGRLEKLERDNRHLKAFAFGTLVLVAALGGMNATEPIPRKITAREFDVLDDSGKVRAEMGIQANGISYIQVNDVQARARAGLTTDASGAAANIEVLGPKGHPLAVVGASRFGGGDFTVDDSQGRTRAIITATDSLGSSDLWLYDASGNRRATMTVDASGAPSIHLSDAQGFSALLGSTATEDPKTGATQQTSAASIVMSGKGHSVIWQAP